MKYVFENLKQKQIEQLIKFRKNSNPNLLNLLETQEEIFFDYQTQEEMVKEKFFFKHIKKPYASLYKNHKNIIKGIKQKSNKKILLQQKQKMVNNFAEIIKLLERANPRKIKESLYDLKNEFFLLGENPTKEEIDYLSSLVDSISIAVQLLKKEKIEQKFKAIEEKFIRKNFSNSKNQEMIADIQKLIAFIESEELKNLENLKQELEKLLAQNQKSQSQQSQNQKSQNQKSQKQQSQKQQSQNQQSQKQQSQNNGNKSSKKNQNQMMRNLENTIRSLGNNNLNKHISKQGWNKNKNTISKMIAIINNQLPYEVDIYKEQHALVSPVVVDYFKNLSDQE